MKNYTDIIIIGAGLSGIGSACHLERKNPEKSYIIIEAREELGLAVRSLRETIGQVVTNLNSLSTQTNVTLTELNEKVSKNKR